MRLRIFGHEQVIVVHLPVESLQVIEFSGNVGYPDGFGDVCCDACFPVCRICLQVCAVKNFEWGLRVFEVVTSEQSSSGLRFFEQFSTRNNGFSTNLKMLGRCILGLQSLLAEFVDVLAVFARSAFSMRMFGETMKSWGM
jgi:hypothetical protein